MPVAVLLGFLALGMNRLSALAISTANLASTLSSLARSAIFSGIVSGTTTLTSCGGSWGAMYVVVEDGKRQRVAPTHNVKM